MREILFRGKRLDNSLWIEGCLRQYPGGSAKICDKEMQHTFKVDPETVGQYTGLIDKDGKRIFEGDILRQAYHPDRDMIIEWDNGRFNFRRRIYPKDCGYESICVVQDYVCHLKVIGNIHDNPELVEVGG